MWELLLLLLLLLLVVGWQRLTTTLQTDNREGIEKGFGVTLCSIREKDAYAHFMCRVGNGHRCAG
jgi:hypothetical protein